MRKIAKKGISEFMIGIIGALLVILALVLVFGKLLPIMQGASESKMCQYSLFVTAATKSPVINNINIPPECRMKLIDLEYSDLSVQSRAAIRDITQHNDKFKDNQFLYRTDENNDLLRYNIDKAIANEIKQCWDVGWQGNINFFDEWWKFYTPFWDDDQEGKGEVLVNLFFSKFHRAPVQCIACARIKFDSTVELNLKSYGPITSINEYMMKTPVPGDQGMRSYWEYTLPSQSMESLYQQGSRFRYDVTKPQVVVFASINSHRVTEAVSWLTSYFPNAEEYQPDRISTVMLMPYEDINKFCSVVIG